MIKHYSLNLQFFSAESEGRTEQPTAKKKDDARKKGQVAHSKELNTAILIVGFCGVALVLGGYMINRIIQEFRFAFGQIAKVIADGNTKLLVATLGESILQILWICLPLWLSLMVLAFIIAYIQVKWKVSFEPMKFKMSKMNPLKGIKRIFSGESIINLLFSIAKVTLLGLVAYNFIIKKIPIFLGLHEASAALTLSIIGKSIIELGFNVGGFFLVLAIADYIYQRHKHNESIKMTKEEVKEEYKNTEGDPQIKGKIKQKMRQMSMQRMMHAVPEADVIITNPTHFAVALKYDKNSEKAPIVVAKGTDYVAQKIKEKAREENVPIVENKPLARSLYAAVDIGEEIPAEMYAAVAEILAYVYKLEEQNNQI